MKDRLLCLLLSALLLLTLCPAAFAEGETPVNWYEIFVRSFRDSDGDGLGDLGGVTEKLDYIRSLGCEGIWLMPIMPSPSYHKYDVTDYYDIDPEYGTLADMRAMLAEAHARGMCVILDLPVNHCSSEHAWFQSAAADESSPFRGWFNWSSVPQSGFSECGGVYYESRFVDTMPDLNLDNPAVREEIAVTVHTLGEDGFAIGKIPWSDFDAERDAFHLVLGELPAWGSRIIVIEFDSDALTL